MTEQEKEQQLQQRLRANYEAYLQQLRETPAEELIEMATEIAAAKLVYGELMAAGAFSEYTDYLLQFKDPLEVVRDAWLSEEDCDRHEELDHALWNLREYGFAEPDHPMKGGPSAPSFLL